MYKINKKYMTYEYENMGKFIMTILHQVLKNSLQNILGSLLWKIIMC